MMRVAPNAVFTYTLPAGPSATAPMMAASAPYGADAAIIGAVADGPAGKVYVKTAFGATRIMDMLVGEQLPRIC